MGEKKSDKVTLYARLSVKVIRCVIDNLGIGEESRTKFLARKTAEMFFETFGKIRRRREAHFVSHLSNGFPPLQKK